MDSALGAKDLGTTIRVLGQAAKNSGMSIEIPVCEPMSMKRLSVQLIS